MKEEFPEMLEKFNSIEKEMVQIKYGNRYFSLPLDLFEQIKGDFEANKAPVGERNIEIPRGYNSALENIEAFNRVRHLLKK